MTEKLSGYLGFFGQIHYLKDQLKERFLAWKERPSNDIVQWLKTKLFGDLGDAESVQDYSHIYRKKTRQELVRISAAVMGIEFSYAAETAFVSPTLLQIGVEHQHMTLVWALSPLVGFFLTPVLGSLSDRCNLKLGRRRPFIFAMSLGVLLGLLLVPNGESLGYRFGDIPKPTIQNVKHIGPRLWGSYKTNTTRIIDETINSTNNPHYWGIFFTVLGTVLLDFNADACQSPARAYLLDVTITDDHARGLSTFTIMAGLGGFMGYGLGGINWDQTFLGELLGGHVRAVFTLVTIIFVVCIMYTVTTFREMPLNLLETKGNVTPSSGADNPGFETEQGSYKMETTYGAIEENSREETGNQLDKQKSIQSDSRASFKIYLSSIIYMPNSMRILCLTNLFCWMAHVCYSLYFTDFVGEAVFHGDPMAAEGTELRDRYESGVRFGCWGMSIYSLSCACYSTFIERLISKFGARKVYVGGLLTYSTGMLMMSLTCNKFGVIVFSGTAGVMYSTLFTMPYLILAHYHAKGVFEMNPEGQDQLSSQIRGLGTDVAIVSSMVFLAQFILSMCMGTIINLSGTTTAVVSVATALAFFGAITATQVTYLDL